MNRACAVWALALLSPLGCQNSESKTTPADSKATARASVAPPAPRPVASTLVVPPSAAPTVNELVPSKPGTGHSRAAEEPVVTLIEPGNAPRRVLRYRFVQGRKHRLKLLTEQKIGIGGLGGTAQNMGISLEMAGALRVAKLDADGTAHRHLKIDTFKLLPSASAPRQVQQSVQSALEDLDGLVLQESVTTRGFVYDIKLQTSGLEAPQLEQLTNGLQSTAAQMIIPLPEEPVGVGAKWKTEQTINTVGLALHQTAQFTLTSLQDNAIKTQYTLQQVGTPGAIQLPGMQGVEAKLSKLVGKGGGSQELDLKSLRSHGTVTTTVTTIVGGVQSGTGAAQTIETAIEADMKFELR